MAEDNTTSEERGANHMQTRGRVDDVKLLTFREADFGLGLDLQRVFDLSHQIQHLEFSLCKWDNVESLNLILPSLTYFKLCNFNEFLRCKIRLTAPRLRILDLSSDLHLDLDLQDRPQELEVASLFFVLDDENEDEVYARGQKIISKVKWVRTLKISEHGLILMLGNIPDFPFMIHLEIIDSLSTKTLHLLVLFMCKTPKLESLRICESMADVEEEVDLTIDDVASCLKTCLKTFTFIDCEATMTDKKLLKFVLQHAEKLEVVDITMAADHIDDNMEVRKRF